jgi:hypothetical protein
LLLAQVVLAEAEAVVVELLGLLVLLVAQAVAAVFYCITKRRK